MVEVISYLDDVERDESSHAYGQSIDFIDGDLEIAIEKFKRQHDLTRERELVKEERLTVSSHIIIAKAKDNSMILTYLLLEI